MKIKRWIIAATVVLGASSGWAKGRRPRDVDYDAQRVRRGSPANPNPAFAPPRFDDDIPPAQAAKTGRPSGENPGARSAPENRPAAAVTAAPAVIPTPAPAPAVDSNAPATRPFKPSPPLPPDASEPPLPEDGSEQPAAPPHQAPK